MSRKSKLLGQIGLGSIFKARGAAWGPPWGGSAWQTKPKRTPPPEPELQSQSLLILLVWIWSQAIGPYVDFPRILIFLLFT